MLAKLNEIELQWLGLRTSRAFLSRELAGQQQGSVHGLVINDFQQGWPPLFLNAANTQAIGYPVVIRVTLFSNASPQGEVRLAVMALWP